MSLSVHGTLVFADLAGFTAFTAERGDAAAVELVDLFEAEVGEVLPSTSRVVKQLGDGLFLWFPEVVPAVDAMTELVERCRLQVAAGLPMWVRVGVHVGSALKRGDDLLGHDVNIASRVTDLAGANEVLLTEAARDAIGGDAALEPVGPVYLKGIDQPIRLFRLAGDSRVDAPLRIN